MNTGILLVLTSFAFGVFVSISLFQNSKKDQELENEERNRQQRAKRVNKLMGKS